MVSPRRQRSPAVGSVGPLSRPLAGNPVGPASGPQTQMAQNLVLSWLAGARIMELKTVQINDRLKISRPCIDATNVGYNIEWSQELRVDESLDQYVQGAMLIHMLRHAPNASAIRSATRDFAGRRRDVYDMSIGYDLAAFGPTRSGTSFDGMIDATESVERCPRSDPTATRGPARPRLSDRAQPQHHALDVSRLPGGRDRAHLRVSAHRDGRRRRSSR